MYKKILKYHLRKVPKIKLLHGEVVQLVSHEMAKY